MGRRLSPAKGDTGPRLVPPLVTEAVPVAIRFAGQAVGNIIRVPRPLDNSPPPGAPGTAPRSGDVGRDKAVATRVVGQEVAVPLPPTVAGRTPTVPASPCVPSPCRVHVLEDEVVRRDGRPHQTTR